MMTFAFFLSFLGTQKFVHATVIKTIDAKIEVTQIADLKEIIWGIVELPDGNFLCSLKSGKIVLLPKNQKSSVQTAPTIPLAQISDVAFQGQGGAMDIQLDPDFSKSKRVFVSYSKMGKDKKSTTALASGVLVENQLKDIQDIFVANAHSSNKIHYGSRIAFDDAGFLYLSIGDRDEREKAQSPDFHNGKIIRMKKDGSQAQVWSLGHRNPQGLVFDSASKSLYGLEHGPRGGDELNLILQNKNYGWPIITYGKEYWGLNTKIGEGTHKDGLEQPVHQFTPSIAPSDFLIYSGGKLKAWKGDFLSTTLAGSHLNRLVLKAGKLVKEERLLQSLDERWRSIAETASGDLLLTTDSGKIFLLAAESSTTK